MEEISKTIDFTNLTFESDPGVHCFNPSIAHWKGNLFLCCYRAFVRYPNQQKSTKLLDPEVNPNHPWLGGDQSVTWWNTVLGGDGTGFCILQIDHYYNYNSIFSFGERYITNTFQTHFGEDFETRICY